MAVIARRIALGRLGLTMAITAIFLPGCSTEKSPVSKPVAAVNAIRDYGYVLGDLIPLSFTIQLPEGESMDGDALPAPGPVNKWLTLRSGHVEMTSETTPHTVQVQLIYQLFKGVREPELATIPPLRLHTAGRTPQSFETPPWSFTVTPVIPPEVLDDDVEVRPPRPTEPVPTARASARLYSWLAGVLLVLALLGLGEFTRHRRTRPFAGAAKTLRPILRSRQDADSLRQAARLLHRAFDQTFGETLFARELDRFCAAHPGFAPLRDRLNSFFALSGALFFDPGTTTPFEPDTGKWLEDLARRCVVAERKSL